MIDHAAGRGDRRGAVRVQDVAYACQRSRRIVRCGCRDSLVAIYSADELMSLRYRLFAKSIGKAINDLKRSREMMGATPLAGRDPHRSTATGLGPLTWAHSYYTRLQSTPVAFPVFCTCPRELSEVVAASLRSSSHHLDRPTTPVALPACLVDAVGAHGASHDL